MKINNLNKTLLAAFMAVTLASCSNSSAPQSDAAANESADTEVVAENSDIIDESIKEDSENNKPADSEVVEDKESTKNSDNKEISSDKKSTIDVEKKEDSSTENDKAEQATTEDTAAEDKEENNSQDNINYQEKDGSYISNLVSSKNGDRDPQMGLSSLSNLNIENNSLILEGSIDYLQNPDSYDNSEDYDKATYNFKINSDTKFQAVGGLAEPKIFSPEEFVKYYNEVKDSGLALKIEVKDGVATTVSIAS